MTVVERKGSVERMDGPIGDRFPVGMRVLAVDDDPTCLKLLESLLLRCQYHVTTTNEAITALKLLRENKDKYDLVISDVHMPDMDGFKLLELVGLEMDLPVIMLSANGQTEAVMKGITHGACDYLLKPIRIEELRNIWQHVVRRRKSEATQHNNSDSGEDDEKAQIGSPDGGQGRLANRESDHSRKSSKRRKDESEDDSDENTNEDEDSSTQKKQRVVWSVELHRKFVAAVNQLGVDKAVPKKILDIMNVEKLTRENVASHLQKYRLFLKKANAMAKSQANLVAALRCRNPGYLPMGSMEGLRNFHPMAGYRQMPVLTPFQRNGALGPMNKPSGFGQQGLMPSRTAQQSNTYGNISNCANNLRKPEGIANLGHPQGNLLQGMPVSLGLDKLQQPAKLQEANNHFPAMSSSNSSVTYMDNTLRVPSNQQCIQSGLLGGHPTTMIPSLSSDTFNIGESYHLHDPGRFSGTWQGAVPTDMYAASASSMTARSRGNALSSNCLHNGTPISHMDSSVNEISPESLMVVPVCDTVPADNVQHQDSLLGGNEMFFPSSSNENSRFLNNFAQKWEGQEHPLPNNPSLMFNSSQALPNTRTAGSVAENPAPHDGQGNENLDAIMIGQSSSAPFVAEECRADCHQTSKEQRLEAGKLHGGFSPSGCSFGDLVDAINKSERDDVPFFDEDIYSLGTCM